MHQEELALYFCGSFQIFRIQIFHALMNQVHAFVLEHNVEKRFFSRPLIKSVVILINEYDWAENYVKNIILNITNCVFVQFITFEIVAS